MASKKDRFARAFFVAATLFIVFLVGFASSHFEFWPHGFLSAALDQGAQIQAARSAGIGAHHMHPARHDLVGVAAWSADGKPIEAVAREGEYTLLTSYWPETEWNPGIQLIDGAGRVVHSWNVDIMSIWPDLALHEALKLVLQDKTNYIHGTYLFENGDVLFNIEFLGLVRMNARGEVVWTLDRRTHHSIHRADNGNFWVCEARMIFDPKEVARRFNGLIAPIFEDRVLEVTPDGKIKREISILDVVYRSKHRSRIWGNGLNPANRTLDVLHLNDVEPLSREMAAQYPLFEEGDLVVSLCYLSLVLVFDPDTMKVKWAVDGPVMRQHDPDFIGDGWVSVFDNNFDGSETGEYFGGSRILAFRPHTGESRQIYPVPGGSGGHERPFYTSIGGKCQMLPNGHWMISEATAGRVFEIDERGRTVWEWGHSRHPDGKMISEVLEGTRYLLDPEKVRRWAKR